MNDSSAHPMQAHTLENSEQELVGTELGYRTLVGRAEELVPLLASRAGDAERLGRTPEDVLRAIRDAGLLKVLRPRRYGGYAQHPRILFDIGSVLAHGCMSTSWVFLNLAIHDLYVANWPQPAQDEVWKDADVLIGSTFVFPAGQARRVDGGYRVSGRWPFSSGVHPCAWIILGAVVQGDGGLPPRQRYFLLKREQYEILDTWHVEALRGTGSDDVEAKEAFVAEHLSLDYIELLEGRTGGAAIHGDPLVTYPFAASGGFILLCAIYGAARGAFKVFTEKACDARALSSGKPLAAEPTYQSKVAEVGALLDTVELVAREAFCSIEKDVMAGKTFTGKEALRLRRDSSFCVRLCVQAIDILFALSGGSALYQRNPLQRAWRDIHGGAAHIVFQWDIHGVAFGRVHLGLPSGLPGMKI